MKILLLRFSSLGDVVLVTAAAEAIREDVPDATVHALTMPAFREVFDHHPGVAHLLDWDPADGLASLASRVRRERYDLVVDLHVNIRSQALRLLLPRERWVQCDKSTYVRRAAVRFRDPTLLPQDHVVDRYIRPLTAGGVRPLRRLPRVYPDEPRRQAIRDRLSAAGWNGSAPLVALAPSARWATKAWPARHWRSLVDILSEDPAGAFFVLLGGDSDRAMCEWVLGAGAGVVLAGGLSILESAASLELADVLVTNDSAPLHLAGAVRTPVVALFGPTVRGFGFYPLGPRDHLLEVPLPCRPCSLHGGDACREGHHACMTGISPERVAAAVAASLARGAGHSVAAGDGGWGDGPRPPGRATPVT